MRWRTHHNHKGKDVKIYLNGKLKLHLKNYKMATISIDIEDNQTDLDTAITNFKTAYDALQNSTLANLSGALSDLQKSNDALAGFQINFSASVVPQTA
jgi:hypothetical protein